MALVFLAQGDGLVGDPGHEIGIVRGQFEQLEQLRGASLEPAPQVDLLAQRLRATKGALRLPLVAPEVGGARSGVELRELGFLRG